jgi:tryptophan synthase alpha chain
VVDLPPEEADGLRAACDTHGLDLVPLIAPTSTHQRIERALEVASGFVYFVSITGITGASLSDREDLAERLTDLRARTSLPVAVGFGIATPEDAARVARLADAVVVGSAAVRAAADGVDELATLVRSLHQGIRKG